MDDTNGFVEVCADYTFAKLELASIDDFRDHFQPHFSEIAQKALLRYGSEGNQEKVREMEYEKIFWYLGIADALKCIEQKLSRFIPILGLSCGKCYPDIGKIDDSGKRYYVKRGKTTRNPFLRSRYCDFAWEYLKDSDCGRLAVDGYLEIAQAFYNNDWQDKTNDCLARALQISTQLNDMRRVKQCIDHHLVYLEKVERDPHWIVGLLRSMANCKHTRTVLEFEPIDKLIMQGIEKLSWDVDGKAALYDLRICFCNQFKQRNLIDSSLQGKADAYRLEAVRRKGDPLIRAFYIDKAIEGLKEVPRVNKTEVNSLVRELKQANKDSISRMQRIQGEFAIPIEQIRDYVGNYMPLELPQCLERLADEFPIMAPRQQSYSTANELLEGHPLLVEANVTKIIDNNIAGRITSGHEKVNDTARDYSISYCQLATKAFLGPLFEMLINEKGLDSERMLNVLFRGEPLEKGREQIVEVALDRFFACDYVSSIHILVFQIEGILREILARAGGCTARLTDQNVYQERMLDDILRDNDLRKVVGDDVCEFLRIILSDPLGTNLRNRIGHGLSFTIEFDKDANLILFVILLRICLFRCPKE